jgi:hypothetical protein
VSARRTGEAPRVIHDPDFKTVDREGRLKLWVKRGVLIVVYVIPGAVSFWK